MFSFMWTYEIWCWMLPLRGEWRLGDTLQTEREQKRIKNIHIQNMKEEQRKKSVNKEQTTFENQTWKNSLHYADSYLDVVGDPDSMQKWFRNFPNLILDQQKLQYMYYYDDIITLCCLSFTEITVSDYIGCENIKVRANAVIFVWNVFVSRRFFDDFFFLRRENGPLLDCEGTKKPSKCHWTSLAAIEMR